jgi:hypothetical protein
MLIEFLVDLVTLGFFFAGAYLVLQSAANPCRCSADQRADLQGTRSRAARNVLMRGHASWRLAAVL